MMTEFEGDWLVALTAAGHYIGRSSTSGTWNSKQKLSPVYQVVYETTGGSLKRYVRPVLLCSHDVELELDCIGVMPLDKMHADDRADWFQMVQTVQKGMEAMRAQKAGILLRGS